jgi:hypothetical protein
MASSERAVRDILAADEAAALLGISTASLHRWSRTGRLPSIVLKEGLSRNVRRWSRRALEAFLAARSVGEPVHTVAPQVSGSRRT